ncbi:hypothetical protein ACFSJY_03755 [Thalassotalea euphylliae]|uniref:hypothetical protein n=1 Tax=Thalassotalea euphylliae TaxID=1655234 RepID=UPI003625AA3D
MESTYFEWLWSMAKRGGTNQLPETIEDLIAVLEVKRFANLAMGWYFDGEDFQKTYKYEVGHRYPCSKGGALTADNLVVMPWNVNRSLGNNHGDGLEHFKKTSKEYTDKNAFRQAFIQRFKDDMTQLSKYKLNEVPTEPQTDACWAIDAERVLERECERLGVEPKATDFIVSKFDKVESKFADICGGLETLERVSDYASEQEQIINFYKRQDNIMNTMTKEAAMASRMDNIESELTERTTEELSAAVMDEKVRQKQLNETIEILLSFPIDHKPSLDNKHPSQLDSMGYTDTSSVSAAVGKYPDYFYDNVRAAVDVTGMTTADWNNEALASVIKGF